MATNILIIQTAFLGDLVLTTPFVQAVRKIHPQSKISILVNSGTESVLENNPHLDSIIVLDKKKAKQSLLFFFKFLFQIRKQNYDLVYSPHFSTRSSLVSYFSGAKERIGYLESGFSFLHTRRVGRPKLGPHEVDKLFSLLSLDSQSLPVGRERQPYLYPDETTILTVLNQKKNLNLSDSLYIVVAPSSLWETKRMPEAKFAELMKRLLTETAYPLVLIGSSADEKIGTQILSLLPSDSKLQKRVINLIGKTNLKEVIVWISQARLLISNDSSPIHFASAFDIPTLMIYGATVPAFGYSTLASRQRILEVNGLNCRPCGIHGGRFCPETHFKCMNEQNMSQMYKMAKELLE